jgi:hypothetical protein
VSFLGAGGVGVASIGGAWKSSEKRSFSGAGTGAGAGAGVELTDVGTDWDATWPRACWAESSWCGCVRRVERAGVTVGTEG